jgi:hypothetical protein
MHIAELNGMFNTCHKKGEEMLRTSPLADLECTPNRHVIYSTLAIYWILKDHPDFLSRSSPAR